MMKKPKIRRYIVEIASERKYTPNEIAAILAYDLSEEAYEKVKVKNATASAIRKLGDQQT